MGKRIDVLSVGDVVTDAFIKLLPHEAEIDKDPKDQHPLLCMTYGTKLPFEYAVVIEGVGNSANAAVSLARLGLNSSLYANIGSDQIGQDMLAALKKNKVQTQFIRVNKGKVSNYHYVLWFEPERTILIKHEDYAYTWPTIHEADTPEWIYLSSFAESGMHMHKDIAEYLEAHPTVKLAFNPGTFQMRLGFDKLKRITERTELFCVNVEEAQDMTGLKGERNIRKLSEAIHAHGPKIVAITDGPNGSYTSDGTTILEMRNYPDPKAPFERTGAGDAYTSTFLAGYITSGDIRTAMKWGPINSMSVVQKVGAQEGLLSRPQLEKYLHDAPENYEPKEYKPD
ncbi:MAG: carbohydrate kinase family protein [bacterium]